MNYSLFLASRLSFGSGGRKSSPAVRVATAAIALSVTVMLASIAIVSGFKREITEKVTGFNSDILVSVNPSSGESTLLRLTPQLEEILDSVPEVTQYALQTSMPAILKTTDDFKGIYLKGVTDSATARFLQRNISSGTLPDFSSGKNSNKIVLSRLAADQLGLKAGDRIDTYFITDEIRVRRFDVAALYDSHFEAYDDVLAFGDLATVNKMAGLDADQGSMLQVTVKDFAKLDETSANLQRTLLDAVANGEINQVYKVDNAHTTGAGYFRWLGLLDMNVIVILSLMTAVGCVTLVSGMLIMILDKKRFIGLLKALGAPTRAVSRVFVYLAVRVTLRGMLIGNAVGLLLLWLQDRFHFIPLDAESYYIDFVPVALNWVDILVLNAGVVAMVYLVLILPSRFTARISPAETMRAE